MASGSVTLDHETHRYYRDGELFQGPSVTGALSQCGLADFSFVDEEIRQRSMARGTSVHWACALFDQGALNHRNLPHALRPYMKAYKAWRKNSGFVPMQEWIEKSFISDLGFSGTIDRVGHLPGMRSVIVDLKTGTSVHPATKIQVAMYAHYAKVFRRMALLLRNDGTYSVREFPFSEFNIDLALGLEAVRRWKPEHVTEYANFAEQVIR